MREEKRGEGRGRETRYCMFKVGICMKRRCSPIGTDVKAGFHVIDML